MNTLVTSLSDFLSMATDVPSAEKSTDQSIVSSNPDPVSQRTVDVVTDVLTCHLNPLVGACGIAGNILTIVVFLMQKRSQPVNSLLVTLATVDTCYLVFVNLDFVACYISRYDVIAARNFTVMTLPHVMWIGITLSRISSMLTVVISVERCVVVMMPLKVKTLVTPLVIHVTTALACIVPALAHVPVFLRGEIQWLLNPRLDISLPYLKLTQFALDHPHFLNVYKNLVLNILFRYVTMGVISVCTGFTIAQLKRYSQWRLRSVSSERERSTMSERDTRVSLTMVRVCVLFLICNLPGCFILSLRLIEPEFDFYGVYKQSFDLAVEINEFSLVINSSTIFLIYLRGSDDFRQTLCKMARTILPACCFRFLFRCVRRTDQDLSKTGSSYNNSQYFN